MAKRSRQTFQKHQKAQARQQKQQQKAARRLQARQRRAEAASAMADKGSGPPPAPAQGDRVSESTDALPRQSVIVHGCHQRPHLRHGTPRLGDEPGEERR
jgi:hypothetical protein